MNAQIAAAVSAVLIAAAPTVLRAQSPVRIGPQVSIGNSADAGVGLRVENRFARVPEWRFAGSFDLFLPDGPMEYWEVNANVLRAFRLSGSDVAPYVGGGAVLSRSSTDGVPGSEDTNLGINVMGGLRFAPASRLSPFVELRAQIAGGEQAVLTTGILF